MAALWKRKEKASMLGADKSPQNFSAKAKPEGPVISRAESPMISRLKSFGSRRRLLVLMALILAGLVVFGYYLWESSKDVADGVEYVCKPDSEIYGQAAYALQMSDVKLSTIVVDKIKKDPNHTKDPSCLAVLVEHGNLKNTGTESTEHLEQLKKVADNETKLSPELEKINVKTVKDVQDRYDTAASVQNVENGSVLLFSQPEEGGAVNNDK